MNPYLKFVEGIQSCVEFAKGVTVSGRVEPVESEQKALLFSPHPDDECITGLLPLRLMREAGMQIINVPVTFGSDVSRQAARAEELKNACAYLGWHLLERENFQSLEKEEIVEILKSVQPAGVVMPHSKDWNSRHEATHSLVVEALKEMPDDFSCTVIETEFWGAMRDPNLMVEADAQLLADLIAAISLHTGEVARNPYHLAMPAWMQDNVRRGGEIIGGQGGEAPDYLFATLYRLRRWQDGGFFQYLEKGKMISMNDNLKEMF